MPDQDELLLVSTGAAAVVPPTVKLSFDDAGTPFLDTGSLGLTWSSSLGDPARMTDTPKFGAGCLFRTTEVSNAGLRVSHQIFDYSQDFTLAFWFRQMICGGSRHLLLGAIGSTLRGLRVGASASGVLTAYITTDAVAAVAPSSAVYEGSVYWIHLAVTHLVVSKTILFHVDGTYVGESGAYTGNPAGATLFDLLGDGGTVQTPPQMHADDFTVLPYALYGRENYTPPTAPL